jgi:hypothetical protein
MLCGRCCVTEPPTKLALRLDIFIEILPRTWVNSVLAPRARESRMLGIPIPS